MVLMRLMSSLTWKIGLAGTAASLALSIVRTMPAQEHNDLPKIMFTHPPSREKRVEWYMELAGNDLARRAAVMHWLDPEGDIELIADANENRLETLRFENMDVPAEDIENLALFPEIRSIEFLSATLSDRACEALGSLAHLVSIQFEECCNVDNSVCRAVGDLRGLQRLRLDGSRVNDDGVRQLRQFDSLEEIGLNDTQVTSNSLKHLAQFHRLQALSVSNTVVDDAGLRCIQQLTHIWGLGLNNTKITDVGFLELRSHQLVSISASFTEITDRSLQEVANFTDLYRLHLRGTKVSSVGLVHLKKLRKLHDLNLRDTAIDDAAVPTLVEMPWLNPLDLRGTKISKEGIEQIRAALKPSAALYNDHHVPVIDRERLNKRRKK
jgi:hypothetical protein